uniref:Integrase family protein n=1 Tax=Sulfobacillus thermotolerans TaxID=338644 RepID=G5CJ90_9FIRM|nr:tyrosine-type recombinase/integrase [Sulfobacillus thermotolerans]AEP14367.1 integrase family protein [Sulfobacillus thermotolerans]
MKGLPSVRETAYPRLNSSYSQKELNEIYTPTPEELIWAEQNTRGDVAHLGLLVLLKISQRLGYFVPLTEIPEAIVHPREFLESLQTIGTNTTVVRSGKGNKTRTVFLSDKLVRLIRDYVKQERGQYGLANVSPYLFLSNRSPQLSRITAFKFFAKYSEATGIYPPISPHDLRHFFCSNALEKGLNVHEVAAIAGHSNIHTTLMYTNPSRKKILEKINSL